MPKTPHEHRCRHLAILMVMSAAIAATVLNSPAQVQRMPETLVSLAREKLGELTEAEQHLFSTVSSGQPSCYSEALVFVPEGVGPLAPIEMNWRGSEDPGQSASWHPGRVLKSRAISWLCREPAARDLISSSGILIVGARVDGLLDLHDLDIPFPLAFYKCSIPQGTWLMHTKLGALNLTGTHTGPICADGLTTSGDVSMRNGFRADGEVRLIDAVVHGNVDCTGGVFSNEGGRALSMVGSTVDGWLMLKDGCAAIGEVNLGSMKAGKGIECTGCEFANLQSNGVAVHMDGVDVQGNVHLSSGTFRGMVNLHGANINGLLNCKGARFLNGTNTAILACSMSTKGGVLFSDGVEVHGEVHLGGAKLGYLKWTEVSSPDKAILDLRTTTVGELIDDRKSWPSSGKLLLDGFTYDNVRSGTPLADKLRIEWLRRQPMQPFHSQPYEQLAVVLRRQGEYSTATKVLVAMEDDRLRYADDSLGEKVWLLLYGWIVGYGYQIWRAIFFGMITALIGWCIFRVGHKNGWIQRTEEARNRKIKFLPLVYSIELLVPMLDLSHKQYWFLTPAPDKRPRCARYFRGYFYLHICTGWVLSTFFVVGLTSLIKS